MTLRSFALALATAALACVAIPAAAQIAPDDAGLGTKLGMAQRNDSGETGSVTMYRRGPQNTLVVIALFDEPAGRQQPAHVHRGRSCDALDPTPAFSLAPVVGGRSQTLLHLSESRLLSGNYVVNVHASLQNLPHYVSCGELYH